MEQKTLYTAIGRLDRETNGCGRSCPVIRLSGQTYMVDMQEMVVWTALNWRISKREDISLQCDKLVSSLGDCISRSWDACVNRCSPEVCWYLAAVKRNTMLCMIC
ncbi:hypothetical protein [Eisenbergiella tayi]|uniref:hypothetical protein n=1 Tax=Eisenbergiella tayi TaxID=1432052 RepID=UPI0004B7694A|nr:hypothetical protein [Eisenbergiella tayi]